MSKIAVLGAGGTGHAIAADLTLAGFPVSLYELPQFKENLEAALQRGGIEIADAAGQRFAKVSEVSTEIRKALEGAEIVLVAVVATRHEQIAEVCAPYLEDGQTIVIGPDNGGSLVFANILKRRGIKADISVAGMGSNYYICRLIGPAKVLVGLSRRPKRLAAFPATDTAKVLNKLSQLAGIYDFIAGTNVLEVALSSPNTVVHLAGSLLNTGAVENAGGQYYLYKQGMTSSVLRCIDAVAQEKAALFNALGYTVGASRATKQGENYQSELFQGLAGPTSMQHRYITEDASTGQCLMVSLADMINVPTPVAKALLTLASVINQTDYLKEGRTVEKLGISGLSVDQLNRFLAEGHK